MALTPLISLQNKAEERDASWYNVATNYDNATTQALEAQKQVLPLLEHADSEAWGSTLGGLLDDDGGQGSVVSAPAGVGGAEAADEVADRESAMIKGSERVAENMRKTAMLCSTINHHKTALMLLKQSLDMAPLPLEKNKLVEFACKAAGSNLGPEDRRCLEVMMLCEGAQPPWPPTLVQLIDDTKTSEGTLQAFAALAKQFSRDDPFGINQEVLAYRADRSAWITGRIKHRQPAGRFDVTDSGGFLMVNLPRAHVLAPGVGGAGGLLNEAAAAGKMNMVTALLGKGITPFMCDANAHTALHRAAENGHVSVCELLKLNGADGAVGNAKKETAYDLSVRNENPQVRRVFEPHTSDEEVTEFAAMGTELLVAAAENNIEIFDDWPIGELQTEPLRVIITGASGSGCATQCSRITDEYSLVHLSTGDLLRAAVDNKTSLGQQAQGYMTRGEYVPDELLCDIVIDRLRNDDCTTSGWLLDGFPRTQAQAQALEAASLQPHHVIFLSVPDEELLERAATRRYDPTTGDVYNVRDIMGVDKSIVARLVHRDDDQEHVVRRKLATFHANHSIIASAYPRMETIDGRRKPDDVFGQIRELLGEPSQLQDDDVEVQGRAPRSEVRESRKRHQSHSRSASPGELSDPGSPDSQKGTPAQHLAGAFHAVHAAVHKSKREGRSPGGSPGGPPGGMFGMRRSNSGGRQLFRQQSAQRLTGDADAIARQVAALKIKQQMLDEPADNGVTPLMLACRLGHVEFVEMLLDRRANVSLRSTKRCSALSMACELADDDRAVELVKMLLDAEEDQLKQRKEEERNKEHAREERRKQFWKELSLGGAASAASSSGASGATGSDAEGLEETRSFPSSYRGDDDGEEGEGSAKMEPLIHAPDEYNRTPLMLCCTAGNLKTASLLIAECRNRNDSGMSVSKMVNAKTRDGGTMPIMMAAKRGMVAICECLLDARALAECKTSDQKSPLHFATAFGHRRTAHKLLEKGAKVDAVDASGQTALMRTCLYGYDETAVMLLEENKADPNRKDFSGETALHFACQTVRVECVYALLQAKADPNKYKTKLGFTPLGIAAGEGEVRIMKALLRAKANIDEECSYEHGDTPLFRACRFGREQAVTMLLEKGANLNKLNKAGMNALHSCATYGKALCARQVVLWAVANKEELNSATDGEQGDYIERRTRPSKKGVKAEPMTALQLAVDKKRLHTEVVKTLLDLGARWEESLLTHVNNLIHELDAAGSIARKANAVEIERILKVRRASEKEDREVTDGDQEAGGSLRKGVEWKQVEWNED